MLPVVLPARERRLGEPVPRTWAELLEPLADRLADLVDTSATVIYGHSMGAWIGYELVRRFRAMGVAPPLHLVVGARRAPHVRDSRPPLARLDDAAFVEAVQARYGAIPDAVREDPEILALFLPAMRGDFALLEGYVHETQPPVDVPITALHGASDAAVDPAGVERWGELTTGPFRLQTVGGGHFFLDEAPGEVTAVLAPLFRHVA